MEPLKKFSLCIACEACPVVEIYEDGIRIGEAGNLVRLEKEEWNRRDSLLPGQKSGLVEY
jgi:hypothetical protein